ncbi:MAG TPA: DUF1571 domain-containing protein [Caulifigura sp.]|nr:DUF1571 domain-containing protein [Caulifigura sp.]
MRRSQTIAASQRVLRSACAVALVLVCGMACAQTAGPGLSAPNPMAQASASGSKYPPVDERHPLAPALKLARSSRKSLESVRDYECLFIKREQLNGAVVTQTMEMKLREEPFSVYLKSQDPNPGREILFVKGQNDNKLLAHEGSGLKSLVGTVPLALDAPQVRAENRHPITEIGMRNLIDQVIAQWEFEGQYGESNVQYFPDARIGGVSCPAIECSHPLPRKQFRFHISRLYIDAQSNLPVRIENYEFPAAAGQDPPLVEEYTYVKVQTNVGLTNKDFSDRNPAYKFR